MKILYSFLLTLFIIPASIEAQKVLSGEDLSLAAKAGKDLLIEDAIVRGAVDFTNFPEEGEKSSSSFWSWFGFSSDEKDEKIITGKMVFRNVRFENEVIAYINPDYNGTLFTASFNEQVVFENCTFLDAAEFKYSNFRKSVDFSGNTFYKEGNFKYAQFYQAVDFGNNHFYREANFKYAQFYNAASFAQALFKNEANFKYTKAQEGLNFRAATFKDLLNLKYAKIDGSLTFDQVSTRNVDTKYTKLNGRDYSYTD